MKRRRQIQELGDWLSPVIHQEIVLYLAYETGEVHEVDQTDAQDSCLISVHNAPAIKTMTRAAHSSHPSEAVRHNIPQVMASGKEAKRHQARVKSKTHSHLQLLTGASFLSKTTNLRVQLIVRFQILDTLVYKGVYAFLNSRGKRKRTLSPEPRRESHFGQHASGHLQDREQPRTDLQHQRGTRSRRRRASDLCTRSCGKALSPHTLKLPRLWCRK